MKYQRRVVFALASLKGISLRISIISPIKMNETGLRIPEMIEAI